MLNSALARRVATDPKAVLIAAAALGQLIMLGAMVFVARHSSHAQLTQYGIFFSVFNICLIPSMLRLEQAILYSRTRVEIDALVLAASIVILPVVLVCAIAAYGYFLANPDTNTRASALTLLLCLAVILGGLARGASQFFAAHGRFGVVAALNLMRPAAIGTFQVLAVLLSIVPYRLEFALVLAQATLLSLALTLVFGFATQLRPAFKPTAVLAAVHRHKDFIYYSLPQNLLFVLSEALVPLSLSFLYPNGNAVALFWLASRVVFAPATVVAESIRPMVYRRIAAMRHEGNRLSWALKCSASLAMCVLSGVLVLLVFGDVMFSATFGAEWKDANQYATALGILVAVNMAALPFVGLLPLVQLQKAYLMVELVGLAARALCLFAFDWSSPLMAVVATTAVYIVIQLSFFAYVASFARRRGFAVPPASVSAS